MCALDLIEIDVTEKFFKNLNHRKKCRKSYLSHILECYVECYIRWLIMSNVAKGPD